MKTWSATDDKVTRSHLVQRVYNSGMQLADALRLLGKHEESHEIEVWVLNLKAQEESK